MEKPEGFAFALKTTRLSLLKSYNANKAENSLTQLLNLSSKWKSNLKSGHCNHNGLRRTFELSILFSFYINIYTLNKKIYNHKVNIYLLWYTWEPKNIHIIMKKQPKNNRKIKNNKNKTKKKKNKNLLKQC